MANTYAINTTRRKEFEVEEELQAIGLHPWVPRRLDSKYIKEKRVSVWYDRPYVHKLIFCVIPAIYWRDVVQLKHVIGKPVALSRLDLEGMPALKGRPPRYGLKQFKEAVEAEYEDMQRRKANSEYVCQYRPGEALEMLDPVFAECDARFKAVVRRAHDDFAKLRIEVSMFGRTTDMEVAPDKVRARG